MKQALGKSDVGSYSYSASGAGSVRSHAVANISGSVTGQANSTFGYDANGNLTSGANRTISWTSLDMPACGPSKARISICSCE